MAASALKLSDPDVCARAAEQVGEVVGAAGRAVSIDEFIAPVTHIERGNEGRIEVSLGGMGPTGIAYRWVLRLAEAQIGGLPGCRDAL